MTTDVRPIAALATAAGQAGVAVLRMSGPGVFDVADRLVVTTGVPPSRRPAGTFFHATIRNPVSRCTLDDALVLIFRAPRSYTGEDAVEIHGHGGSASTRRLLEATLQAGARLAAPGEFTRRAFLNGRLDLTQAEAVADLIQARTDRAAAAAHEQLEGRLGRLIVDIYDRITSVCCDVEAMLDWDENDLPSGFVATQHNALAGVAKDANILLSTWREGRLLRDGALVVIAGRTNVGKSSLLNALLGHDRAIVTPLPGTTRDTIEESCSLDGVPVRLVDTAGLRDAACEIEQIGIERTRTMLARADAVLYVVDGSKPPCDEDVRAIASLPTGRSVLVLNKQDLRKLTTPRQLQAEPEFPAVCVSALAGSGLDELRLALSGCLASRCSMAAGCEASVTVSERHRTALIASTEAMRVAQTHLEGGGHGLVLAARELRQAAEMIGQIIGRTYTDDLLDLIFSRFCVGK
jgi:tRNA modification GTPase